MDGTILSQGFFTQPATAVNQIVAVPSGVDWIRTVNYTQIGTPADGIGIRFYWQYGMPQGYAIQDLYNAAANAINVTSITTGGFSLYDPSLSPVGPAVATTASTNAVKPVISTGSTAGLIAGTSIVRLYGMTAVPDISGIDFVIDDVTTNTSFRIQNALATAPGAAGGAGFYSIIAYDPLFYPRHRYIASITQATNANVLTTVPHGYVNGQVVRFTIPNVSGMVQLNGLAATVTVVDANNFTININTTTFTAFTFPTAAQAPCSIPMVVPVGENTGAALTLYSPVPNILSDATLNTGYYGIILPSGANSPGGQAADVVYWVAGKADFGGQ